MARLKRSIADVRAKWAQQKNLYEAETRWMTGLGRMDDRKLKVFPGFPPKNARKKTTNSGVLKDGFFGLDEVAQDGWMGFV